MILIDIGNSTFHILQNNKTYKISIKDNIPEFKTDQIFFLSVNEKANKKLLNKYPNAIDIKSYFNFQTSYAQTMGIDRIAVCSYLNNSIIVDCGSAITVDIKKESKHLGGFIMPGIDNLKSIYPQISPKLAFNFENNINLDKIPLNTNDAINYAIISMIILPIKDIQNKYNLNIIFTGENSKLIQNHFKNSDFKPNLVFDAMKSAIRENK